MQEESSLFSLSLESSVKNQLSGLAVWARVFAVASLVLLAVAIGRTVYTYYLLSRYDFYSRYRSTSESIGAIAGYLLVFMIPAIALIYLLRFSSKLKTALNTEDQASLSACFKNLKIYFRYTAIIIIILMAIVAITWIVEVGRNV